MEQVICYCMCDTFQMILPDRSGGNQLVPLFQSYTMSGQSGNEYAFFDNDWSSLRNYMVTLTQGIKCDMLQVSTDFVFLCYLLGYCFCDTAAFILKSAQKDCHLTANFKWERTMISVHSFSRFLVEKLLVLLIVTHSKHALGEYYQISAVCSYFKWSVAFITKYAWVRYITNSYFSSHEVKFREQSKP